MFHCSLVRILPARVSQPPSHLQQLGAWAKIIDCHLFLSLIAKVQVSFVFELSLQAWFSHKNTV